MFALTGAKTDERDTTLDMIDLDLVRPGQTLMADKGYRRAEFEAVLNSAGITLIRPPSATTSPWPANGFCVHSVRSSS